MKSAALGPHVAPKNAENKLTRPPTFTGNLRLAATFLTEFMWRHASVSAEKACEVRGVGKGEIFSNLVDRMASK